MRIVIFCMGSILASRDFGKLSNPYKSKALLTLSSLNQGGVRHERPAEDTMGELSDFCLERLIATWVPNSSGIGFRDSSNGR